MSEGAKILRLSKLAIEFNIGISTIVDFLAKKGINVDQNPNTKISEDAYQILAREFQKEKSLKDEVRKSSLNFTKRDRVSLTEKDAKPHGHKVDTLDKDDIGSDEKDLFIKDNKLFPADTSEAEITPREKIQLAGPKIIGKLDDPALTGSQGTKSVDPLPSNEQKQILGEEKKSPKDDKATVNAEEGKTGSAVNPEPVKIQNDAVDTPKSGTRVGGVKILGKIDIKQTQKPDKTDKLEPSIIEKAEKTSDLPDEVKMEDAKRADAKKADTTPSDNTAVSDEQTLQITDKSSINEALKTEIIEVSPAVDNFFKTQTKKLEGVTIVGRIELPIENDNSKKPVASSTDSDRPKKRKRKRIRKEKPSESPSAKPQTDAPKSAEPARANVSDARKATSPPAKYQQQNQGKGKKFVKKEFVKTEPTEEEISRQIRETLATLSSAGKSKGSKYRRLKRDLQQQQKLKDIQKAEIAEKVLKVTEFVSANELASMMNVQVTEVISTCMNLGLFVSINQRLDAETITIVADEFGYGVDFVSVDVQEAIAEIKDSPEDLVSRAPIVTVMGHVDHGKTSLLDKIRHSNVIAGEAGGITQHIGAYSVKLDNEKMITFLDTPGHEAFTAMRARGARITDVAIIVVAGDDNVMPQTVEAINHAQAANVPIVIAINKIDKPGANVERVKEELAKLNILVEDWGGKYQSQEISAKNGINIDKLLEKVLLEAELLDLRANPNRRASGTVIESSLDKGRGYLATILVQNGTLKVGDIVVAGNTHGKIKAMFNERNMRISSSGPATPALILGLDGAPQAGDTFNVVNDEQEAKSITIKRQQLLREQGLRTQKHITLDEIGRRIAIGDFKELNIIVKGDVDGSVEALSDSLLKLSTGEVQVNIIHKAVGPITEGDVLLASASNAVVVGFQVRPSLAARKLAENEQIDIRIYSVIYNAINEIKSAIEGMLSPEIGEKITANIEVREVFKITKVGTIAGCLVLDGKITRNSNVRIIRDGIVVYTGNLGSLKRFKDDVREVTAGYECGLNIDRFNDIKVGDIVESFETYEIARKLV